MSRSPALDLAQFLPFRLSVLSNTVSTRIAELYAREFDLSVPQWRVMVIVKSAPGVTATQVSERTAMDKVAVSRAVSGLLDSGRLDRRNVDRDGRARALYLTLEGERIFAAVAPLALGIEAELLETLTQEERTEFDRLLTKLAGAISPDRDLW